MEEAKKKAKTQEKKEEKKEAKVDIAEQLKKAQAEANDYKDRWMRNVAEFDNYKKRTSATYSTAFEDGVSSVVLKILNIGDTLDYALNMGLDEKTTEGIKGIIKKYNDTLKEIGVEEIDVLGKTFDPNLAEAVMQVPKEDGEEDVIKQVFQKGYKIKDKIIRYAKVSVTK